MATKEEKKVYKCIRDTVKSVTGFNYLDRMGYALPVYNDRHTHYRRMKFSWREGWPTGMPNTIATRLAQQRILFHSVEVKRITVDRGTYEALIIKLPLSQTLRPCEHGKEL